MTAQVSERIIIDGVPHELQSQPLYRLLAWHRVDRFPLGHRWYTTACYRCYVGTWKLVDGRLYLAHLCAYYDDEAPLSEAQRNWLLRVMCAERFPVHAYWFNGRLKIPLGRQVYYVHHGFGSVYERTRVVTMRQGRAVRDRIVDTEAIMHRRHRRNELLGKRKFGEVYDDVPPPLCWSIDYEEPFDLSDWWPPDYRPEVA